jgi:hypothetical protein
LRLASDLPCLAQRQLRKHHFVEKRIDAGGRGGSGPRSPKLGKLP